MYKNDVCKILFYAKNATWSYVKLQLFRFTDLTDLQIIEETLEQVGNT